MSRTRRGRREGFDYFVDKYESTYQDDIYDDDFDDEDGYYAPVDRFARKNRYTGEIYRPKHINTSTLYGQPQYGTLEFSAVNGHGLDPNMRPLGDQTMMITSSPNPYMQQLQQQTQQVGTTQQLEGFKNEVTQELDQRFGNVDGALGALSEKVDASISALSEKIDKMSNTLEQTLENDFSSIQSSKQQPAPQPATQTPAAPQPQQPMNSVPKPPAMVAPKPVVAPQQPKVQTTVVNKKQPPKKKISKGVLIGGIIGIIFAVGLIVVGVLMIMGVISF